MQEPASDGRLDEIGARKASEIVMLIFRALQFSRFAMLSALVVGSAISSSRQRSFLTLQSSWESTFHRGEPWMVAVRWLQREAMAPALGLPLFDLPMAIVLASRLKSCTPSAPARCTGSRFLAPPAPANGNRHHKH